MSWNARILNAGPLAFFREHVTVADTTGLNLDAHFSRTRLGNLAFENLEIGSRLRNLGRLHRCYCDFRSCHGASFEFSAMVLPRVAWESGAQVWF